MPKITFVAHDGTQTQVEAASGLSVMQAAINNNVRGIDGDCGGQCACATCHVFVSSAWAKEMPGAKPNEEEMLNFTAAREDGSRLACQIVLTDALDGLTVRMPAGQH